jgi:PAS domain S-box-containing protein
MIDEPDIVKILRDEEKLGRLNSKSKSSYEELMVTEKPSDEGTKQINGFIEKDIRRKTENTELRNLEEVYQTVFENSAVAIMLTDENEQIIYWNKYAEALLDINKDDLYMKPVKSLYPPEEWKKIRSENIRQKGMQHHLETKILRKNNEVLDVDISLSVLKDREGNVVGSIGIIKDITERKRMENALEESEEKFKQLYEKAPIPYHTLLPSGKITDVNEKWCQILRYKKEDVIGRSIFDFIAEDERDTAKSSFEKKVQSKKSYISGHERTYITKYEAKRIFVINDFFSFDKDNNVKSVYTTMDDITEIKKAEAEIKEAHEALTIVNKELDRKVQKRTAEVERLLRQKDEFISQLGHDLKTPLTILLSVLPMIKKEVKDKDIEDDCGIAIRNVNYIKSLVIETLKIAEISSPDVKFNMVELKLRGALEETIEDKQLVFEGKNIRLKNNINKEIIVKADKLRLEEVFHNLITNAIKYIQAGEGTITFDAEKKKDFVTVSVKDTGIGITKEQLGNIFNDFYKADESRHELGSVGLGLSICKRIIDKHGGRIWAESPGKDKGTTFYFTLKLED